MSPSAIDTVIEAVKWSAKQATPAALTPESHKHGGEDLTPLQAVCHGDKTLPAIPSFVSKAEERIWLLEHMAAVFRCWARMGFCEGLSGHISVRDPEREAIWMNPLGKHFGLMTAGDMICLDMEGRVIGGNRVRAFQNTSPPQLPSTRMRAKADLSWYPRSDQQMQQASSFTAPFIELAPMFGPSAMRIPRQVARGQHLVFHSTCSLKMSAHSTTTLRSTMTMVV